MEQLNAVGHIKIDFLSEFDATGGWYMQKAPEPVKFIPESELIQEMRLMHVDFVEEAYWKRVVALKLA